MDLHEYFGLCADHDWKYVLADDKIRYIKGFREGKGLMDNYRDYQNVYIAWRNYIFHLGDLPKYEDFIDENKVS